MAVLYGVFLYMGVTSLQGVQVSYIVLFIPEWLLKNGQPVSAEVEVEISSRG